MTPPFTLPAQPVDGYEVRWYRVGTDHHDFGEVRCGRAVYRLKASWREIFPDDNQDGAPFEDEWQVFDHTGWFSGRAPRWDGFACDSWSGCFAIEAEAKAYAIELVSAKVAGLTSERERWVSWLRARGAWSE